MRKSPAYRPLTWAMTWHKVISRLVPESTLSPEVRLIVHVIAQSVSEDLSKAIAAQMRPFRDPFWRDGRFHAWCAAAGLRGDQVIQMGREAYTASTAARPITHADVAGMSPMELRSVRDGIRRAASAALYQPAA